MPKKITRPNLNDAGIEKAMLDARNHFLNKLRKKKNGALISPHETYGIVAEEVYELLMALHQNNDKEFKQELLDIATACLFGYASL